MRFLLARVSLRWQLASLYVLCLSAALFLLGLVLYAEVRTIVETSVYDQLQADANRVLSGGSLHALTPPPDGGFLANLRHWQQSGPSGPFFPPCPGDPGHCATQALPASAPPAAALAAAAPAAAASALDQSFSTALPGTVAARFVDGSGAVIAQSGSNTLLDMLSVPTSGTINALDRVGLVRHSDQGSSSQRLAVLLTPSALPDGSNGVLEVATSLSSVDGFLAIFRLSLLVGSIIALGSGTMLGLAVTRRLLRPLDRMAGVSWTVASGDLSRRFNGPTGSREVTTLARNFNHMIDRLEASLRSQQRFTADAAHELRTPLTALGGNVELLLLGADEGDPQRVQKALRSMDLEIQRLTRLVNDLLQLSRMEGQSHLQFAPLDVAALLSDVAAELRLVGPHAVVQAQADGPLVVSGDRDRLKQVLLNIGDNALKFTPTGGAVTLSASRLGNVARLRISDSGPGIPPADLPRIFDRLYRGDSSRARLSGGMGLGLAIAKAIVEAHHGTIIASSILGRGATFTVDLPLDLSALPPAPPTAPTPAAERIPVAASGIVNRLGRARRGPLS